MPVPSRDVPARAVRRSADRYSCLALVGAAALTLTLTACSGGGSAPSPLASTTSDAPGATASASVSGGPQGLAVPGIPDPCGLLTPDQVLQAAHIPDNAKTGAVASNSGGRSCAYNSGHPDAVTISLTAVTKAGFDAFRATIPANTVTDMPGLGQEAYRSSQTPGVVDVFKNGFDLNVAVIHADSDASASGDAKALATLLVAKL
ncbi:MAG: DUF3558 family protein [Catenulispora sp.]|nr:DUF3558 family protein [Catenulispora sp.]